MPISLSVLGACAAKRYGVAARSFRGRKKQEAQLKSTVDLVTSQGGVSITMALRKRIIPIETTPLVPMFWQFSPGFLPHATACVFFGWATGPGAYCKHVQWSSTPVSTTSITRPITPWDQHGGLCCAGFSPTKTKKKLLHCFFEEVRQQTNK